MATSGPAIVSEPGADDIRRAADRIRDGALVAFPTETVYGLGADATNDRAVAGIFAAKQRPSFNPLICHFKSADAIADEVVMDETARHLAATFWPGSLTMVLPRKPDSTVSRLASADLDTLAVRVPDHPLALQLLDAVDRPIAAPSANRSGELSPTRAAHVAESLSDVDIMILDGGACGVGLESTVVGVQQDGVVTLLREGGIAATEVERVIGRKLAQAGETGGQPASPGMLARHYGTAVPLRMNADKARVGEIWICFGPVPAGYAGPAETLSESRDLREAAANLFDVLHRAGRSGAKAIAVAPIPDEGLGRAINDRLKRSAAAANSA